LCFDIRMQTRRLGSDGPDISVVGYGAWEAGGGEEWGSAPPDERSIEAMRAAIDAGMTWIDTAEVYGDGHSEELVGHAVTGRRDEILLFSKVAPAPDGTGFRPEEVRAACRASLGRLRTDRIDLFQLHWEDETGVPLEDTWDAMAGLVDEGLVRWIGVSNFDRAQIERCEEVRHVDSLQQECSMLVPDDLELIAWCGDQGIGVLSYAPLAYGLLTGAIGPDTTFDPTDHRSDEQGDTYARLFAPGGARTRSLSLVDGLRPIAERLGCSVAQLALAWNHHQPGVTAAIAGSRNVDHVRHNAGAGEVRLDASSLEELRRLLPAV
jgi:aryl-alcohol dehydrogenase-like predicted oxidoreductase